MRGYRRPFSRFLVEGDGATIKGSKKHFTTPNGYASVVRRKQGLLRNRIKLGRIAPNLIPGGRINGENAVVGGDVVQHAVNYERCRLQTLRDVARLMQPCDFELLNIALIHFIERTKTPPVSAAMIFRPVSWIILRLLS